jgi:hypothetical protein
MLRSKWNWHNKLVALSTMPAMPSDFFIPEYARQKNLLRRAPFLDDLGVATLWPVSVALLLSYYSTGDRCGRLSIGLERMLRMFFAQQCICLSGEG